MIGGLVQAFGRNFNVAEGRYFVAEGDEYDTAFFDKGPKFLHYRPRIAILTSIEFDHADIYDDLAAIKASFAKLVAAMPADGFLVACWDDPVVREVCQGAKCSVVGYGCSEGSEWRVTDLLVRPEFTSFQNYHSHHFHTIPGLPLKKPCTDPYQEMELKGRKFNSYSCDCRLIGRLSVHVDLK